MLGPMTNPANVKAQVIGVFNAALCQPIAKVMQRLGSERVLVVHAQDGLDEISLATPTRIAELKQGVVSEYTISPEELGVASQSLIGLTVDSAAESFELIKDALGSQLTPAAKKAADILALNAGAALYVCGVADSIKAGVALAQSTIKSGAALTKINALKEKTQTYNND
jgi:anthranilate phosphoribosyltransferase